MSSVQQPVGTARDRLVSALREHALVLGEVVLTSGQRAQYLVDCKRALLRSDGLLAAGELVAEQAVAHGATAVGGMTMGADPIVCGALATPAGAGLKGFFVRKERKAHALGRRIEGPLLTSEDRCLIVEDVVTTGGSTIRAIEAVREEGHLICGVVALCDRLAGGAAAIEAAAGAPFVALSTIDEVYPERPDR